MEEQKIIWDVGKHSLFTGKYNVRRFKVYQSSLDRYFQNDGLIQDIFPYLSADDREFIISGITPEEWPKGE